RLIDTHTLNLVEFSQDVTIPPYAILSHRWTEEVVYTEYLQPLPETKSKLGYLKIEAACRQARHDGIRYLWVDTCCIKQGDPADVAENIMSMYAYYQNAEVCYAYLVDVKSRYRHDVFGILDDHTPSGPLGQGSEWFHRGWTLQELIAPRTVVFFNKDWQYLTDKHNMRDDIYQVTSIPPTILVGTQSIQDVDFLTRMSWSVSRNTTKKQDLAYCLQGLLGVVLEPDYNEPHTASFNRLGKALLDANPD
ncbi:HET-domain-containing protein, partial [Dendrothele bispora CBS 962.96]